MATFICVKRRLVDEPLDTLLVRSKRRRVDDSVDADADADSGADEGVDALTVLERVATVETKEVEVGLNQLKEYRKGWELRQRYKRLGGGSGNTAEEGGAAGWKEARRRHAKEREKRNRYLLTASFRGDTTTTTTTTTNAEEEDKQQQTTTTTTTTPSSSSSSTSKRKKKEEEEEEEEKKKKIEGKEDTEDILFYDTQICNAKEDRITCNGCPMEVEKCVYDLYYYPKKMHCDELVCELMNEEEEEEEERREEEEEDDDENEENNWRNEYPEEEEEEEEEDEDDLYSFDYVDRLPRGRGLYKRGSEESFDLDEYEEEDVEDIAFDEYGNLVVNSVASLSHRLAHTGIDSEEESE